MFKRLAASNCSPNRFNNNGFGYLLRANPCFPIQRPAGIAGLYRVYFFVRSPLRYVRRCRTGEGGGEKSRCIKIIFDAADVRAGPVPRDTERRGVRGKNKADNSFPINVAHPPFTRLFDLLIVCTTGSFQFWSRFGHVHSLAFPTRCEIDIAVSRVRFESTRALALSLHLVHSILNPRSTRRDRY